MAIISNNISGSRLLIIILLVIGGLLRLQYYLVNPSVWANEGWVALDILHRSFQEMLWRPIPDNPTPIGFNVLEKLVVLTFGLSEWALRAVPFIASQVSLVLFYKILLRCGSSRPVMILALCFMTFCEGLIYHAAEIKPYAVDVMVALILTLLTFAICHKNLSRLQLVLIGLAGMLSLWVSYPALFLLATLVVVAAGTALKKRDRKATMTLIALALFWMSNFIGIYFLSLKKLNNDRILQSQWTGVFNAERFVQMFQYPVGLGFPELGAAVFLIGCIRLFQNGKTKFFSLLLPVVFTVLAALLGKYPFEGRLLLFLTPIAFIGLAEGIVFLYHLSPTTLRFKILSVLVAAFLLFPPLTTSLNFTRHPRLKGDMRPLMSLLKKGLNPEDAVYMNNSAHWSFLYYLNALQFPSKNLTVGMFSDTLRFRKSIPCVPTVFKRWNYDSDGKFTENRAEPNLQLLYAGNPSALPQNPRAWILFSDLGAEQETFLLTYLDEVGTRVEKFQSEDSTLYLYNLAGKEP